MVDMGHLQLSVLVVADRGAEGIGDLPAELVGCGVLLAVVPQAQRCVNLSAAGRRRIALRCGAGMPICKDQTPMIAP